MKRFLFILAITMATVFSVQAAHVSEAQARQIAGSFFSAKSLRAPSHGGQPTLQLAYTADREHFYIYDRGHSGFVVVAGDDRLPQVLGYSETGHFSATQVPPAMKYWMQEMNRQIAYLQEHDNVVAQVPFQHETAVDALMTTLWDQGTPFNDLCPTYTDNAGNIYIVLNNTTKGAAMFGPDGSFIGYYGANRVQPTAEIVGNYLTSLFTSEEKRARRTRNVPTGITSFGNWRMSMIC